MEFTPKRYMAYDQCQDIPNIVVDGSPNRSTVLTISHWPGIPQPPGLAADLSAEMVFNYLDAPPEHPAAEVVTNNHFDQDGLVGIHAMVSPELSLRHRDLLIDVAAAGDFGTYRHRDAARASMAIWAYAEPKMSPIADMLRDEPYPEQARILYETTLPLLIEMATNPERFRELWGDEDDRLTASEKAVASGDVTIEEHPAVDLAVVTIPEGGSLGGHRFGHDQIDEVHPMAINNATDRHRLLLVSGRRYRYLDRYETWVQYCSRPTVARVDMAGLADRLTEMESGSAAWRAGSPKEIMPSMSVDDESSLDAAVVVSAVIHHLRANQ